MYSCVVVLPLPVVPSPKSHDAANGSPSESVQGIRERDREGLDPDEGSAVNEAIGPWFVPGVVTEMLVLAVSSAIPSETVSVGEYVPTSTTHGLPGCRFRSCHRRSPMSGSKGRCRHRLKSW